MASVLRSRWLTMGARDPATSSARSPSFIGAKHAFAVANCTAALHLACVALGIGPGDEVIVPALTFVATANARRATWAPDRSSPTVESETDLTISPTDIERKITPAHPGDRW